MNTRLTGWGVHGRARCWTQRANAAFNWGSSTTFPSTPAVARPALISVTRRTLSSVFERDRSISFCKLRTFFRSPACDAVKILCRRRRTSSSARRQSTDAQSRSSPSGPFTLAAAAGTAETASSASVMVSNLPLGSVVLVQ